MKASILAALLLCALPAAAQTNDPLASIPREENQLWRQNQIDALRQDQQQNDLFQQQEIARLQEQLDGLNLSRADLTRLQQALDNLQNQQQFQRVDAERRILAIAQQGDTARRRRWAAQFTREQQNLRLRQQQSLADIAAELGRFGGK